MTSRIVNQVTQAAIIVASALRTGRTVYLADDGSWRHRADEALIFNSDGDAQERLEQSKSDQGVIDPYLVNTDAQGQPLHIREMIRTVGPTVFTTDVQRLGEIRVSI